MKIAELRALLAKEGDTDIEICIGSQEGRLSNFLYVANEQDKDGTPVLTFYEGYSNKG